MTNRGQGRILDPQVIYDVVFNLVHAVGLKLELKMDTGAGYGSDHGYKLSVTRTYGAMTSTEQALLTAASSMLAPPTQLELPASVEQQVLEIQGENFRRATADEEAATGPRGGGAG